MFQSSVTTNHWQRKVIGASVGFSENLDCGVIESNEPGTNPPEPGSCAKKVDRTSCSARGSALASAVTILPPEAPSAVALSEEGQYLVSGFSDGCKKVVFSAPYRYPGLAAVGSFPLYQAGGVREGGLYEWEGGRLAGVSGSSRLKKAKSRWGAGAGSAPSQTEYDFRERCLERWRASVLQRPAPVQSEWRRDWCARCSFGKAGESLMTCLCHRRASLISGPLTSGQPRMAQKSSTANAGLTDESHLEGQDLYEYNLESDELSDLTIDGQPGGAEVIGFVGGSSDGSAVYFVARGELDPGNGRSFSENVKAGTYSLYQRQDGTSNFVATVGGGGKSLQFPDASSTDVLGLEGQC